MAMLRCVVIGSLFAPALAMATASSPELGKAEAKCRPNEHGPALMVNVVGLKDRRGTLKLEVYPSNDTDFLADDNVLIDQGKTFRRVETAVPASGQALICVRVPGAGAYSVTVLHDRDGNRKFSLSDDGLGFAGNPKLHRAKPKAAETRVIAGSGLTSTTIVMNYLHGFFAFGPLKGQ
jgi:uncharacterized protein (DUF2141 family)